MENYELNEKFREACYLGDLDLVRKLFHDQKPDINSKNKVNGWTPLHWASKRNNFKLVEYLLSIGARPDVQNNDNKTPGEYTTDSSIAALLNAKIEISPEQQIDKAFVPNFVKNPVFHYSDKSLYSSSSVSTSSSSTKLAEFDSLPTAQTAQKAEEKKTNPKEEITVKLRDADELDFIEIDLDKESTSFEQFKQLILTELEYDSQCKEILKIRKLPNVLIRNTKDIKRLQENQEIEVIFKSTNK